MNRLTTSPVRFPTSAPPPSVLAMLLALAWTSCKPAEVDETGYLQPPEIDTTAEEPPDEEEPRKIIVVGSPGAVSVPGGILVARASSGSESTITVEDPDGSFVASVDALKSDTIELTYTLEDDADSIVLSLEGTALLSPPSCPACFAEIFSVPDGDGLTSVDLSLLTEPRPPFILLNQTRGIAVRTETIDAPLKIRAESGDRACLLRDDVSVELTSAVMCALVP